MPSRERLQAIAMQHSDQLARQLGREARRLRVTAGVDQAELARAAGVSRGWVHRLELGRLSRLDLRRTAVVFTYLGHKLVAKPYPTGDGLRDAGQERLLDRFDARLPPLWRRYREAVMPIQGDLRAWDELLVGSVRIGVEAETKPSDLQATERAIAAKQRDSGVDRTILLIASTDANRAMIRRNIGRLRQSFPLDTRSTLAALGSGRDPGANALVIL
jgi:transcriptional regulator with XRE-family HTH domain